MDSLVVGTAEILLKMMLDKEREKNTLEHIVVVQPWIASVMHSFFRSYKELMVQCNVLGRSESRMQQKIEKAKELIKKLRVSSASSYINLWFNVQSL